MRRLYTSLQPTTDVSTPLQIEKVKKKLKSLCRPGLHIRPEFAWPLTQEPFEVVKETIELMKYHRSVMHHNWETMAVEKIQTRWCCGEYPYLFRGECSLTLKWCRGLC